MPTNRIGPHAELTRGRKLISEFDFKRGGKMARGGKRPGAGRPRKSERPVDTAAPTAADRRAVLRQRIALCVADQMSVPAIAAALGITEEWLRANFANELEHGAAIIRAQQLAALAAAADAGNASAARALHAIAAKPTPSMPSPDASKPGGDVAARALRILDGGKK